MKRRLLKGKEKIVNILITALGYLNKKLSGTLTLSVFSESIVFSYLGTLFTKPMLL